MTFTNTGAELLDELVDLRRKLHRVPELGLDLPQTQALVLAALEGLDLEIVTGRSLTSVVAVLRGKSPGPAVLLRGDMDALPLTEPEGLEYRSENGNMHACGHDLHTAALVGAAKILAANRDQIAGSVIFMFQPGEERAGGARIMLDEGVLDTAGVPVVAAYAIHVGPGPFGVFATRPGTLMAGSNVLEVTVRGRGGHGSNPSKSIDPVPVLAEIILGLQTFVTRRFEAFDPIVLTVTMLRAGNKVNIIPDTASFSATIRTLSENTVRILETELPLLVQHIAAAHGAQAEVDLLIDYPPTVNDAGTTAAGSAALARTFGAQRVAQLDNPLMGSEDFSYVARRIPSAFFMLMCTPPGVDHTTVAYNHSSDVVFDDGILGDQAAALATLAVERLAAESC